MLGENLYYNFGQKKQLNLYLRVLYYVTTKPKIVLEQFTIRKTHARDHKFKLRFVIRGLF